MMYTMVICGTMWGGFWLQFVIGFMYNSPAIHTLSRGNWFAPYVQFYLPVHPLQSISLAENFAWFSVFGSLLALLGIWHWTSGVRGRWKMRMLVAGFAVFLSVWSLAALAGKDAAWQALEDRRMVIQREMQETYDADMIRWLKSEKEGIEQMLKTR